MVIGGKEIPAGSAINPAVDFYKAQYGKADIAVTLNGESRSRFMFTHEVNELLGEKARVAGCYELPLYLDEGEQTAFGVPKRKR